MMLKLELQNVDKKKYFFRCSFNFRVHVLQLELNKVSISNFVKFQLESIGFKIARAIEKMTKISIKIWPKWTIIRQLKVGAYYNGLKFKCQPTSGTG